MADAITQFSEAVRKAAGLNELPSTLPGDAAKDAATLQAVMTAHEALMRNASQPPLAEEAERMGIRPGVATDVTYGAEPSTRFWMGFDPDKLPQFKYLLGKYGAGNVDIAPNGGFVLRNQIDPVSGIKQDVLVNPPGMEQRREESTTPFNPSGDISEFLGQTGPMIAGAAAARLGLKVPVSRFWQVASGIGFGALAQRGTEGMQQSVNRIVRGDELNLGAMAKERSKDALEDAILGATFALSGKLLTKAITPFGRFSPEIEAANEARDRLNAQLENKFPETIAMRTGNPFLLRIEAGAKRVAGSAGVFDDIVKQEQAAVDEMRRIALGVPRTMSDEQLRLSMPQADIVGQRALGLLGSKALTAEGAVETAKQALNRTGTLEAQLTARTMMGAPIPTTVMGEGIIAKTKSEWQKFHQLWGKRYEDFFSRPETTVLDVSGDELAKIATQLRKEYVPLAKKIKEVDTGLVKDELGTPHVIPREAIEELDRFIQPRVLSTIDELEKLKGATTSVRSLKQIRTNIDDAIAANQAIPGTDTHQLISIRSKLSEFIGDSLQKIDPDLAKEWNTLNAGWSKNMARFDRNAIRDMLIPAGQPGAPGPTLVAERVLGNSPSAMDTWHSYEQFFGKASPEMNALRQTVRSKVITGADDAARGYISGSKLRSNLTNLRDEVAQDVFGTNRQKLLEVADALATGQGKFDAGEVLALANSKTLTKDALMQLGSAETQRATLYDNALIAAARKGALGPEQIQPSEFVRYMTNGRLKLDPDDIRLVKSIINEDPNLARQVEQLAVEDFFERSDLSNKATRMRFSQDIDQVLGNEVQQRRWEALLGKTTVDNLKDLSDSLRPGNVATEAFKSMGSLAGGQYNQKIASGKFEGLPEIAKRYVLAKVYSTPFSKTLIANRVFDSETASRFINAMVTSEPFATEMIRRFGPDAGRGYMSGIRGMVDAIYQDRQDVRQMGSTGVNNFRMFEQKVQQAGK